MKFTPIALFIILSLSPLSALGNCLKGNCVDGQGTFITDDGDKYVGSFKNNKFEGVGQYYYVDGSTYKGMFKRGQFDGQGIYKSSDGKIYEGEWKKGLPNGQGIFRYSDNSVSKGHFKNGKLDEFGTYLYPDGKKLEGEWKNGEFLKESPDKKVISKCAFSREELAYYVNENAKNLPIKTDSVTSITGIMLLSNNTILWRYILDKEKLMNIFAQSEKMTVKEFQKAAIGAYGSVDEYVEFWKENVMKENIINRNCSTPSVRKFLDGGVTLKHSYYDMQGSQFIEVIVDKNNCK